LCSAWNFSSAGWLICRSPATSMTLMVSGSAEAVAVTKKAARATPAATGLQRQ